MLYGTASKGLASR